MEKRLTLCKACKTSYWYNVSQGINGKLEYVCSACNNVRERKSRQTDKLLDLFTAKGIPVKRQKSKFCIKTWSLQNRNINDNRLRQYIVRKALLMDIARIKDDFKYLAIDYVNRALPINPSFKVFRAWVILHEYAHIKQIEKNPEYNYMVTLAYSGRDYAEKHGLKYAHGDIKFEKIADRFARKYYKYFVKE